MTIMLKMHSVMLIFDNKTAKKGKINVNNIFYEIFNNVGLNITKIRKLDFSLNIPPHFERL